MGKLALTEPFPYTRLIAYVISFIPHDNFERAGIQVSHTQQRIREVQCFAQDSTQERVRPGILSQESVTLRLMIFLLGQTIFMKMNTGMVNLIRASATKI